MNKPYEKIDVVISTITKFLPKDIEPWVESLNRSGFSGKRMMIVYDVPQETINYLKENHFDIFLIYYPIPISRSYPYHWIFVLLHQEHHVCFERCRLFHWSLY